MIEANALEIHVNTAQELPMDEGDREFYWLENINEICKSIRSSSRCQRGRFWNITKNL